MSIAASRSATVTGSGSSTSTWALPMRSRNPANRRTETSIARSLGPERPDDDERSEAKYDVEAWRRS